MKPLKITLLAVGMLATGAVTVSAQTAAEIMDKHEKAVGGLENWDKIKTAKLQGSLIQGGMEVNLTQTYITDKAMRQDISLMGMSGFMIYTPTAGYTYMPFGGSTKVDTLKPEAVKAIRGQISLKGMQMLDYKTKGTVVELAGKETINNATCYKMTCTNKDGEVSTCYIDATTYYISRIEKTLKVDDQDQEIAIAFNNYQKQPEGIVMPMSMTAQGVEITFTSMEFNKPVDEKIFVPTVLK